MTDCNPRLTPSEQRVESNCGELTDAKQNREIVDSLNYAMTYASPDLS